ncbi:MAG: isopentenyl-diphosphate Delta-isomerase [Flavitalea sp.]
MNVILVDEHDNHIGEMEKMEAHRKGLLHRAFSVFIFNSKGEMLLQQRARQKYHSGGLWTNACCSHPFPGEAVIDAASRRLFEEMGFLVPIEKIFDFTYRAEFENGLTEHEFDHVFYGIYNDPVEYNRDEVMDYCYRSVEAVREDLERSPEKYTAWFRIVFPRVIEWTKKNKKEAICFG